MWSQDKTLKNTDLGVKCRLIILLTVWYQPTFLYVFSILSPHWTPYWTASNWPRSSWTPVFVLLLFLPLGAPPLAVAPPPNNLLTWHTVCGFCIICMKYSWTHCPRPSPSLPLLYFRSFYLLQQTHPRFCLLIYISVFLNRLWASWSQGCHFILEA